MNIVDQRAKRFFDDPRIHHNIVEFAVAISKGREPDERIVLDAVLTVLGFFETMYIIKGGPSYV